MEGCANATSGVKKVLVLGASPTPWRYAHEAVKRLKNAGHQVLAFGKRKGSIDGIDIVQQFPKDKDIHTVTVYLNARHQGALAEHILGIEPQRVIFNPGAENQELETELKEKGVEVLEACTLVMLSTGQF